MGFLEVAIGVCALIMTICGLILTGGFLIAIPFAMGMCVAITEIKTTLLSIKWQEAAIENLRSDVQEINVRCAGNHRDRHPP